MITDIIVHAPNDSLNQTTCRPCDQEWIQIFVLKHKHINLHAAEKSDISTYLRRLWLEIAQRDEDGLVFALVSRGPHVTSGEPARAPKHITLRLFNRHVQAFATAHIPPRMGETVQLLPSVPQKWNGVDMNDQNKFELVMHVGLRDCVKTTDERSNIINSAPDRTMESAIEINVDNAQATPAARG
ncbi:hypothetical protein NP233_g325 [Leucocoprinus birnbaumii]|uniref:Uncharacterized protein n=1 Tax=Leucocoprinus birnbaumii TaxID=56174 RepID=A0AAD5YYP8_9AGAR|nr:hypothetical protein NP233_g325 [Leucocoprinus birnbaumii]